MLILDSRLRGNDREVSFVIQSILEINKNKMKDIDLSKIKKAHFVGIGGIGVSAIARMMIGEGKKVSGSDSSSSAIIDELQKHGAKVFLEHDADNVASDVDLIVYTPAVDFENPELKKGKDSGIPCLSYP